MSTGTTDNGQNGFRGLLARDEFVRANLRAIATIFVRPSVRPSVRLGWTCIVIIRCTLARI